MPNREFGTLSRVDRAVDRSPSAVDRYNPVHVGARRSTGPVDRAVAAAADSLLLLLILWLLVLVDFLDFLATSSLFLQFSISVKISQI